MGLDLKVVFYDVHIYYKEEFMLVMGVWYD